MFHPALPIRAQIIIAQTVMLWLDQSLELCLQGGPSGRIDLDLEDGKLHTLAEITAGLADTTQARRPARFDRADIIGHEHEHSHLRSVPFASDHRSFPEPGRIGVEI